MFQQLYVSLQRGNAVYFKSTFIIPAISMQWSGTHPASKLVWTHITGHKGHIDMCLLCPTQTQTKKILVPIYYHTITVNWILWLLKITYMALARECYLCVSSRVNQSWHIKTNYNLTRAGVSIPLRLTKKTSPRHLSSPLPFLLSISFLSLSFRFSTLHLEVGSLNLAKGFGGALGKAPAEVEFGAFARIGLSDVSFHANNSFGGRRVFRCRPSCVSAMFRPRHIATKAHLLTYLH